MAAHPDVSGGALAGVRVLDLTWGPAGAIASMILADHGAEVVRVDRPGGDPARRAAWCQTWDRGKRSVVLDLADPDDRAVLRELAATADVVMDGLGKRRLAALGCGYDDMSRTNPAVVYCVFAGWGPELDDPLLGNDLLAAAKFGVMAESPGHRDGPIFPGHPATTYATATVAAIGTLAALRARIVTGQGDRVDVSNRDGVLALMTMNWWNEQNASFIRSKSRTGRLDMGRTRILLEKYTCADGRIIQLNTAAPGAFGRALEAFGIAGEISAADGPVEMASELTDADLAVLQTRLPEIVRSHPAAYWLERLWDHQVAALPVQPPGEVFSDDQVRHAGVMRRIEDPDLGEIEVVGPVVSLSVSPAPPSRPAPRLDEHGAAVRAHGWHAPGLGQPAQPAASAVLEHPLSGVRIVELSNYFASPSGNRFLRDLGADVVKIEPVHGDPVRALPDPCEGANGGKRSIAIDIKARASRPVLDRLLATADVVQHNMRPGAAERAGIDEATVRALNEDIIYAYGPGYGSSGPKALLQSFAPLHSGFVGLMHLAAGEGNEPHTCFGNEDYYAGLLSASGILLALIHRDRTGVGQGVEVSQLLSSVFVTSEHFVHAGAIRSTLPPLDHDQTGWSPACRLYQCLDGWLCVACTTTPQADAFRAAVVPDADPSDPVALADALQYALFMKPVEEWRDLLRTAGVPCEVAREDAWLDEFLNDAGNLASGASVEIEHPIHGRARVIGPFIRLARRPGRARERGPRIGEHTTEVLQELGFGADEAGALAASGAVASDPRPEVEKLRSLHPST